MTADYAHIVEGCRRHDRRAQRELYDTFAPMAMGVCMRYATDRDAAQDLLQDGFVRVYENIGKVRDPQRLGAWIYRLMLNECLKDYRRRGHTPFEIDIQADGVQLPMDPFGTEEVVQALQRLPMAQRMAFNLVEVEGYTYADAAAEMKSSEVNVRALLSRAKGRLRELLTER